MLGFTLDFKASAIALSAGDESDSRALAGWLPDRHCDCGPRGCDAITHGPCHTLSASIVIEHVSYKRPVDINRVCAAFLDNSRMNSPAFSIRCFLPTSCCAV